MGDLAPLHATLADDPANERLQALVATGPRSLAPSHDTYDLIAVGGGTAGLVGTAGMAMLGARVALIERHLMGGDCLVTGCVPSKALIHAARLAHDARGASRLGVRTGPVEADFGEVMRSLRQTRSAVAEDDSIETVVERGVEVLSGQAEFTGPNTIEVDGKAVGFKRCLVATGGRPKIPSIPGLSGVNPLTSESVFELTEHPGKLVIIGGGPIGCELAQALGRLDVTVTVLQRGPRLLPADDPEASEIITERLRQEGVTVRLQSELVGVTQGSGGIQLRVRKDGIESQLECDRVLVATGRQANVEGLGLDKAGVKVGPRGIVVDKRHRTSNRRIYAAGDVAGSHQFTHAAWAQSEYAVLNAFFPVWLNVASRPMPWATYTDPEVAHVGLPFRELAQLGDAIHTITVRVADNDRARIEGEQAGFARVHLRRGSDRIIAATVIGRSASELIVQLGFAITRGIGLSKLASTVVPYPTRSEMVRDLAYAYSTQRVTPTLRRWAKRWFSVLR